MTAILESAAQLEGSIGGYRACTFVLNAGGAINQHDHPIQHATLVWSGRVRIIGPERTVEVVAPNIVHVPEHTPHRIEAIEAATVTCLFSEAESNLHDDVMAGVTYHGGTRVA